MEVWNGIRKKILVWNGIWNGRFLVWNGNGTEENYQYGIWKIRHPFHSIPQRWSRGHKARGQGHKKNPRPRPFREQTLSRPRTGMLEAKAKDQGQKKKRSSQKFFKQSPQKNVFQKFFQPLHKILTIQKIVLSLSRGQANFRGLEASKPRPRTSKCVLEDSTSAIPCPDYRYLLSLTRVNYRSNLLF